jgi:hypothetical protein
MKYVNVDKMWQLFGGYIYDLEVCSELILNIKI